MERARLTLAAIARLRPREREYTVWDTRVAGLGVRVRPGGGKSHVLLQRCGKRSRRVSLGPVPLRTVDETRRDCLARLAAPEPNGENAPKRPVPTFRELSSSRVRGCRRGEILNLRWSEVRDGTQMPADSTVGPRSVSLNSQARRILDIQRRGGGPFVFPSPRDPSWPRGRKLSIWDRVRKEAGIEDVRLHDLRPTHASHAVMNGCPCRWSPECSATPTYA